MLFPSLPALVLLSPMLFSSFLLRRSYDGSLARAQLSCRFLVSRADDRPAPDGAYSIMSLCARESLLIKRRNYGVR